LNDITEVQKSIDTSFLEFEDVKSRVDVLTSKYSLQKMDFDGVRDKIQEHVIIQRARLQKLQPERDTLAADIGMIEKTLGSLVEKSSSTCSVCYERQANVALKPCGHVYCEACVSRIHTRTCPKCRDLINGQIKLYF
jgi:L-lysine 2,3-aminomutase